MEASRIREHIQNQSLLGGLPSSVIDELVDAATAQTHDTGTILFRYGDAASSFYVLTSGRVVMEVPAIQGPNLELHEIGPGELLGWSWLIAPYKWSFQARVRETSELIAFDGERIRARCEADHEFGYAILSRFTSLMSQRLEAARCEMMRQWNPPGFA